MLGDLEGVRIVSIFSTARSSLSRMDSLMGRPRRCVEVGEIES